MYLRMVDGAGEERFMGNKTMLVIEEECHEDFTLQRGELQTEPVADRLTGGECLAGFA
jgi:hypothetical protein